MTTTEQEWIDFAAQKLSGLDCGERKLAEATAYVLASGKASHALHPSHEAQEHHKRCAAVLVAIVELARAVARGDLKTFQVVKA